MSVVAMSSKPPSEHNPDSVPDVSEPFEQERERMHRQMLSSVSHDLKTPLASIIGSLEVYDRMKDKLSEDKRLELVRVALQEGYRLDNFITNILDMAKLENGMVKAKDEVTEVGTLLKNCLLRLNTRLKDSTVKLNEEPQLEIATDPLLLSRAVCQILDNAVKFGGKPSAIDISYGEKNGVCFVAVSDNGFGITPDKRETVFAKYTRFAREDQQNAGTGLGLSIAREIMRLLGGTITVTGNNDRGGAVFRLTFPKK